MRVAMDSLSLFSDADIVVPAVPADTEASGSGIGPPAPATTIAPVSAARAAGLKQLAHLWRADDLAPAAGRDATVSSGFAALDAELPGLRPTPIGDPVPGGDRFFDRQTAVPSLRPPDRGPQPRRRVGTGGVVCPVVQLL
jgi:hypothetical protein